jgi:hypothetical protein
MKKATSRALLTVCFMQVYFSACYLMVSCLAWSSTLRKRALSSSETPVNVHRTPWRYTLEQWFSTWGTRRHFRGYVKLKIYALFHDKHWIIRALFRVSHRKPDVRIFDLGAPFLSLSLLYAILISAASFILFHAVRWNGTESWFSFFSFKTYYLTHYFECNLFNLF